MPQNLQLNIRQKEAKLWAEAVPVLAVESLLPLGDHQFYVMSMHATIQFKMDKTKVIKVFVETPDGVLEGRPITKEK
ncbi:MAG: hypothetical protein AAFO94_01260 [Bacteroidota bacterium]